MGYRTLLVHVEPTPESDLRVRAAVEMASRLGAALIGIGGCEPAYLDSRWGSGFAYGPLVDGTLIQDAIETDAANCKKAEASFRTLAAGLGPAGMWRSQDDFPALSLPVYAAAADLLVASARSGPRASTAGVADLVMGAGIPVLAIPIDLPSIAANNIAIAWKNTRESRRAVSDAMPLLRRATEVTVLTVSRDAEPGKSLASLEEVAGRLQRQGVKASVQVLDRHGGDAVPALVRFADDHLVDIIVAGAYGHSRLREWVLGGVTQGLLDCSPIPVLFSH